MREKVGVSPEGEGENREKESQESGRRKSSSEPPKRSDIWVNPAQTLLGLSPHSSYCQMKQGLVLTSLHLGCPRVPSFHLSHGNGVVLMHV